MFFQDARDYQILFLAIFLFLGVSTRDWTLQPDVILAAILSCLLSQLFLSWFVNYVKTNNRALNLTAITSCRSAAITALGLCLLLRTNSDLTMAIAGFLAIGSKFLFRIDNKHFFNPANFGIITALVLSNDAWVSPGQWGTDWWYLLLFLGAAGIILQRVGRWDTSGAFLLAYTGLEAIRNLWLGWTWDVLQHQLMSGSLLLFAFFMITDPRSIPNATISRIIWALSIAGLTFICQHQLYLNAALFWALFCLSPLTIFLDSVWPAPRFSWRVNRLSESLSVSH